MAHGGISLSSRALNRLTDRAIRAFIAGAAKDPRKVKKLSDGGGMALVITPAGSAAWRLKYRIDGTERSYSIGVYPAVSLEAARQERDRARALVAAGKDPTQSRRIDRATASAAGAATFGGAAADWLESKRADWHPSTYETARRALERDVLPRLAKLPILEIRPSMVGQVVDAINARGSHETAAKVLWLIRSVFEYALHDEDSTVANPADRAKSRLRRVRTKGRRPALLEMDALRDILKAADLAAISPAVRQANRLLAFSAVRPGNAISAEWSHVHLDTDVPRWVIPRHLMKVKDREYDHTVFLGSTIAAELREWRERIGGHGYLFASPNRNRPHIGVEALDKLYARTLGLSGQHSPHGWRSGFKTLAIEVGGFSRDATELALDHVFDSATVRAYDRGERREERIRLANWWGSQLTGGADD